MKKIILLTVALFLTCSLFALAGSPVVGTWDCIAYVDQDYPFILKISEQDGELTGTAETQYGESTEAVNLKLEDGMLSFGIDSPEVGMIDFKAKLEGDTLKGTLEGYDFSGEFTAKRQ